MFALPSFLSFPLQLPSFPTISLPANIQRRFLSYVLKRALGRFIKSGLDVDKIQGQISAGWVELEGLHVDEQVRRVPSTTVIDLLKLGVSDICLTS
jgi:autophagy-related protein 2